MTTLKTVFLRTGYNYDTQEASINTSLHCPEKTLTQQQFKEETDINEILRKFNVTGQLPDNIRVPQYGDFTGVVDYQTAMNAVIAAKDAFNELPAEIRAMFNNDPQELLEFVADDNNYDEAAKMGLVPTKPISQPDNGEKGGAETPAAGSGNTQPASAGST